MILSIKIFFYSYFEIVEYKWGKANDDLVSDHLEVTCLVSRDGWTVRWAADLVRGLSLIVVWLKWWLRSWVEMSTYLAKRSSLIIVRLKWCLRYWVELPSYPAKGSSLIVVRLKWWLRSWGELPTYPAKGSSLIVVRLFLSTYLWYFLRCMAFQGVNSGTPLITFLSL